MNSKRLKIVEKYKEKLDIIVSDYHSYMISCYNTSESIEQITNKIIFVIANKIDSTFLQLKTQPESCHQKDIKKAMNILDTVLSLSEYKTLSGSYLKKAIQIEEDNLKVQSLLSFYCVIAQNDETKEYARLIYETDGDLDDGYVIEFTKDRAKATEISKIAENTLAVTYIQKLLLCDFPEINWKVFKSARMVGRETTQYPVY